MFTIRTKIINRMHRIIILDILWFANAFSVRASLFSFKHALLICHIDSSHFWTVWLIIIRYHHGYHSKARHKLWMKYTQFFPIYDMRRTELKMLMITFFCFFLFWINIYYHRHRAMRVYLIIVLLKCSFTTLGGPRNDTYITHEQFSLHLYNTQWNSESKMISTLWPSPMKGDRHFKIPTLIQDSLCQVNMILGGQTTQTIDSSLIPCMKTFSKEHIEGILFSNILFASFLR